MKPALDGVDQTARTLLQDDLLCLADSKLVLGNWFAECVMNGKSLPDFAAMLGMCTASYGQTRAIFHYLDTLDHSYAYLERGRGPDEVRSMDLLDAPPENWQDFIVSVWLAEQATWSMASGFLRHRDRTVAGIARKIGEEAYFHLKYAVGWLRLLEAAETERALVLESLRYRYPLALRWFGPCTEDDLHAADLRDDPVVDIRSGFAGEVNDVIGLLGVSTDELPAATFGPDWRPAARRTGDLPAGLFEVIRFKDEELAR